jgi:primosomal protein N' (replication factor Y)
MKSIAQIIIGLPVDGFFDYLIPDHLIGRLSIGQRVAVPFGRKKAVGYIAGFSDHSDIKTLKALDEPLEDFPLVLENQLELGRWIADYYGCSWGEAVEAMLPFSVRQKKTLALRGKIGDRHHFSEEKEGKKNGACHLFLSQDEDAAWEDVVRHVKGCLDQGKGVLFLAPDHIVSGRIYRYFENVLQVPIARLDSGPSKRQVEYWLGVRHGETICAIGLRSGVFTPVKNLGLAVMFGEQQYGYQEDQAPFYHARDILLKRAANEGFHVIFSSVAPTVELWSAAEAQRFAVKSFSKEPLAACQLIDLRNYKPKRESYLSIPLADAVGKALDRGERVLIIYNRRGFNTLTKCGSCGHVIACQRCHVPYVYVYGEKIMRCPSCGGKQAVVKQCPECRQALLQYGEGIERIESNLARFFPQANITTFDRDTKTVPKRANLIIATQAVLRVIRELNIDLAGVLDIDAALSRFDFRCQQKVFSLLMEVRASIRNQVIIQTKDPRQGVLDCVVKNEMERFYQQELEIRRETGFPPVKHLLAVMLRGENEGAVTAQAEMIYEKISAQPMVGMEILPPQPDFQPKLRGKFRFMIMTKCLDVVSAVHYIKTVLGSVKKKHGIVTTIHVDA